MILASLESDIASSKNASNTAKEIAVLDAVHMLADAWKLVKPSTIANCFRKAFNRDADVHMEVLADIPTPGNMDREEFEALVEQDVDNGKIEEEDDEQNVVEDEPGEVEQEMKQETKISYKECLECVAKVRNYCQERERERGTWRASCMMASLTFKICALSRQERRRSRLGSLISM